MTKPLPPLPVRESRWPHRLAVMLVVATFPLIWVGGLVTTYDAGMAVPDWPSTYGYNLFLYPWQTWVMGPWDLFVEHGHRLLGATAGLLTIAFVVAVWLDPRRRRLRGPAVVALLLVIGQGLLGGVRVLADDRRLALVHGCVGPLFFALCVALAVKTSRRVSAAEPVLPTGASRLQALALVTVALIYAQLVLGAHVRHVAVDASWQWFRGITYLHLLLGTAVALHVLLLAAAAVCSRWRDGALLRPAALMAALVAVQIVLGIATWRVRFAYPEWVRDWWGASPHAIVEHGMLQAGVVTAHVAIGSLLLATAVVLALRARRLESASNKVAGVAARAVAWSGSQA